MSRRWFLPGLLTILFVAVAPSLRGDDEPTFNDKTLSYWIKEINQGKTAKARKRGILAVETIGYWSSQDKALPALVNAMKTKKDNALKKEEENEEVRAAATRALGRAVARAFEIAEEIGKDKPKFDKQRDEVAAVLKTDKAGSVREAAAWALADFGPQSKGALGALSGALKDKHAGTTRAAATALRKLGKEARDAESDLVKLVGDKKADVVARTEAARCLAFTRVDGAGMLPTLKEVAGDSKGDTGLRRVVCETIGKLGKDGVEASATLGAVLVEKVPPKANDQEKAARASLRLAAVSALSEFGSSSKAAIPQLITAVDDTDRFVRCKALSVLGVMGLSLSQVAKTRDAAWEAIKNASEDTNTEVAVAAMDAIGALGADGLGTKVKDALVHLDKMIDREGRKAILDAAKTARDKLKPKKGKG